MYTACGSAKVHLPFVYGLDVSDEFPAIEPAIDIVRSARRRRTVSAHRVGDRIVVQVPARMTRAEEAEWVDKMVRRVLAGERRRLRSDDDLLERARRLSARHLAGRATPS